MKFIKNSLFVILCIFLFVVSFGVSAFNKVSTLIGFDQANYTLQGETSAEALSEEEYTKEIVQISFISSNDIVEKRPIIIYRPASAEGEIPLIYVPHYAAEENSADFQSYIRHGWACASPTPSPACQAACSRSRRNP